ncbi:DUF5320 family protein [Rhodomicrobium sp. Az07]|nr:DUF5320 family protein [Rhodomicrobium sp. Az07]
MDKTGPFGTGPVGAGKGPCQRVDSVASGGRGRGRSGGGCKGRGGFRQKWSGRAQLSQTGEAAALELTISALQTRLKSLQGA